MAKYIYRGKTIEVPLWAKYIPDFDGEIDDGDAVDESYTDIVDCAEDDFIVGDTVKLNSGGPLMTVDMVTDDYIYVVWFNDSEYIYCHHMFIKSTIHLVD